MNPNQGNKGKAKKLIKLNLDWFSRNIPTGIGESAECIKAELRRIENGESDIQSLIENIEASFGFSKGPLVALDTVYLRTENSAKTKRQLFAELAPGFFTSFLNPDLISLLLQIENGLLNEMFAYAIINKHARLREKKKAIRDVAWYLTYGLLPREKRDHSMPSRSAEYKLNLDFSKRMFDCYQKLVTAPSMSIDFSVDSATTEWLNVLSVREQG